MVNPNARPNPFVGPRAYQTGETLHGRERESRELLDLLIAERIVLLHSPSGAGKSSLVQAELVPHLEEEGFRVLPVIRVNLEPSPTLVRPEGFNRYVSSVLLSLEEALPQEQRMPLDELNCLTLDQYLSLCPRASGEPDTEVLIFDQFEEILTVDPTDREGKMAFFVQVGAALRQRKRWALFSMREDYMAALDPYLRPVPTRLSTTFRLDFLTAEAARRAIQKPCQDAGVNFTDRAAQKLVEDLCRVQVQRMDGSMEIQLGPYVEPVQLQVVCFRLWEHLPPDQAQIVESDIAAVGDVDTALAEYYAERVASVAAQTGASERLIRDWFEHQLITPQGIRGQVLMGVDRSEDLDNEAIHLLENTHLVRAEKRGGSIWFELAHDRLIGPVRGNNAAWFQANLSLFQRQAGLWELEKRPDSLLLRDKELDQAEEWVAAHVGELTEVEQHFLEVCRELRNREQEAKKLAEAQQVAEAERERAELEARSARRIRRLARIIAGALVIAVLTTILAGIFWQQSTQTATRNLALADTNATFAAENAVYAATNQAAASTAQSASTQAVAQKSTAEVASTQEKLLRVTADAASALANEQKATAQYNAEQASANAEEARVNAEEAEKQAGIAFSRQLASQSLVYLNTQPDLALLLGVESYKTANTLESRSALIAGLQRGLSQTINTYARPIPAETTAVLSVDLSLDGERLAWSNADGEVVVWNYVRGALEQRFPSQGAVVWSVAFSPDGKTLAASRNDQVIDLWDLATGKSTHLLNVNKVLSVSWSPDGKFLAAAVGPRLVIWETSKTDQPVVNKNLNFDVNSVSWSPDGTMIASANSNGAVYISDPATGETSLPLEIPGVKVKSVAWSPDNKFVASGSADRQVIVWEVDTGLPVSEPLSGHKGEVISLAFSHDGSLLASGSQDGTIILWDVRTLQQIGQPLTFHSGDVYSLIFRRLGGPTVLASGSGDKTVQMHEIITQQPLSKPLPAIPGQIIGLAISAEDTPLAASRQGTNINVWDDQAGIKGPAVPDPGGEIGIALSQDGKKIAIGDRAGGVAIFDTVTGGSIQKLETSAGEIMALAFSQDGKILAIGHCTKTAVDEAGRISCEQNEILRWDMENGTAVGQPLQGHKNFIRTLAFSPDGSRLASGSQDKTILVWDLKTGTALGLPLTRHLDRIISLAFSPDGKTLASSSADNTLILWDVETGQPIGVPIGGSSGVILSLAFAPDGKTLASGDDLGVVLTWDIDVESWIQRACQLAGRNMSQAEWGQLLRGQEYRQTCAQFPPG